MRKVVLFISILIILFSCSKTEIPLPDDKIGELVLNPNGQTPLSLVYKMDTNNNYPVTVITEGRLGDNDIIFTYPKITAQILQFMECIQKIQIPFI